MHKDLQAILRNDFKAFLEKCFETLNPGQEFHDNWHIDAMSYHLMQVFDKDTKRLIITLPPRHLKSLAVSVAFPAWVLGHMPEKRIIAISYSEPLASYFSRDCRRIMEETWYKKIFPKARFNKKKNTEKEIVTEANGYRYTTSFGGSLTGRGGNLIIIDDPIKVGDAWSDAERNKVNAFYRETLASRLDNKNDDAIIITMQRVHEEDLVGHVLPLDNWTHLNLPVICKEETFVPISPNQYYKRKVDSLLHPAREDQNTLDALQKTLGSAAFSAQYQQAPIPPEGNLVKRKWFKRFKLPGDTSQFEFLIQAWDTAMSVEAHSDYSVCTTWGIKGKNYYLLDIYRKKLLFPDLVATVKGSFEYFKPNTVLVENASSGTSLAQTLRSETYIPIVTATPAKDKVTRLGMYSSIIESGRVYIPEEAPWLAEFLNEVLGFPHSKHDDQVDSMTLFLEWVFKKHIPGNHQGPVIECKVTSIHNTKYMDAAVWDMLHNW